jgi:hypothetical protein
MMRAVGVFAFVAMMLVAGVTEVPAVAFNSAGGIGSCSGNATTLPAPTTCAGGWVAVAPDVSWQPNNPGGSSAVWVSYTAGTGSGGVVVTPNVVPPLTPLNATETFTINIPAGFASLSLLVWADDTAGVRLDGGTYIASTTPLASAPNPTQGAFCAAGGLTCTAGGGAAFSILLGGTAHDLHFDVFQRGAGAFGLLYSGDLQPVPEPTTMLLVGSVLAGVGYISRRRLQKTQV